MVVYWVAYVRGSFYARERYMSSAQAVNRCLDLLGEARLISIVPCEEDAQTFPSYCIELPPVTAIRAWEADYCGDAGRLRPWLLLAFLSHRELAHSLMARIRGY